MIAEPCALELDWQKLTNQLPTGVVIIDGQGVVEYCNLAAKNFLGDIQHSTWADVIQTKFAPKEDDGHEISLLDGRKVNINISSMAERPGEIIVINDLTRSRAFEHERARLVRLQEMGQMLAHLAHQIRTPLSSAMLYLKNMLHPDVTEEKKVKFIKKIKRCHQNIEQQIKDLLVFAKGDGSLLQTIAMSDFIELIQVKAEPKLNDSNVKLVIDNQAGDLSFLCQGEALEGVMSNLIDNAINANASQIFFNIRLQNNQLIFSLIDNGDGMDESLLTKITQPFFTTRAKGSGLGLAVVDAVVKSHAGKLSIVSQKGGGSHFAIEIPLITQHADKESK